MALIICQQCLEPFEVEKIKASRPRKFCSMACSNRSRAKYPELTKAEYDKIYRARTEGDIELKERKKASSRLRRGKMGESLKIALLSGARARAKRKGLPFNIDISDIFIPNYCPVLGLKLEVCFDKKGGKAHSPSLDRINPTLGYVKGNVLVMSRRANLIKTDASLVEIEKVAAFLRNLLEDKPCGA